MNVTGSAVGHGASVHGGSPSQQSDVQRLLTELSEYMTAHGKELTRSVEAEAALDDMKDELARPRPEGRRIMILADRLKTALLAGGVVAAPAVELAEKLGHAFDG